MFKNVLLTAVVLVASSSLASAQDIFLSFSSTEVTSDISLGPGDLGSAYIFSDGLLAFDSIDINSTISDSNVVRFTGGEAFNPTFNLIGGQRFESANVTIARDGSAANLFALNIFQNGVDPSFGINFDPGFDPGVGPNGALLLARVDFEINGEGNAEFEFSLGAQGVFELPATMVNPSFASATVSSLDSITLGDVNLDGAVNVFDIMPFIQVLFNRSFQDEADVDVNGAVNFLDIGPFCGVLLDKQ